MATFDITKLTPEVREEIAACKTAEELKAYFATKNLIVPDSKLEAIFNLAQRMDTLDMEELEEVTGGCNYNDICPFKRDTLS